MNFGDKNQQGNKPTSGGLFGNSIGKKTINFNPTSGNTNSIFSSDKKTTNGKNNLIFIYYDINYI